jgi:hypothetical protein
MNFKEYLDDDISEINEAKKYEGFKYRIVVIVTKQSNYIYRDTNSSIDELMKDLDNVTYQEPIDSFVVYTDNKSINLTHSLHGIK